MYPKAVQEGQSPIFFSDPAPHSYHGVDHHPQFPSLKLILYQLPGKIAAKKPWHAKAATTYSKSIIRDSSLSKARSGRSEEREERWPGKSQENGSAISLR